jgi:hypothetical protein
VLGWWVGVIYMLPTGRQLLNNGIKGAAFSVGIHVGKVLMLKQKEAVAIITQEMTKTKTKMKIKKTQKKTRLKKLKKKE